MTAISLPTRRDLTDDAERQIRAWTHRLESRRPSERKTTTGSFEQLIRPYIAIAHEIGVDAIGIASETARKLGWKVLDPELLDCIAEHYDWSSIALDYVDERTALWFGDTFGGALDKRLACETDCVRRLGFFTLMAAQHESHVFVGRGAEFLLPRESGLAVRIIAAGKQRIARIVEQRQCSPSDAENFIQDAEKDQADFFRQHFQYEIEDSHYYDLVINTEHTTREAAADLILGDYLLRFEPRRVVCAFHVEADRGSQRL